MFKHLLNLRVVAALCCAWLVCASSAFADALSAKASVSSDVISAGDTLEYTIEVNGAGVETPRISVDGIDVVSTGSSTGYQIGNGGIRAVTTLNFTLQPRHTGTFTIPAIEINAGGKALQTQPVSFKVEAAQAGQAGQPGQGIAWAEIVLPKKTAYVGEQLPAELRLYVDAAVPWQLEEQPTLDGEGFTKTKLPQGRESVVQRDGRQYHVAVFRTAITPIQAGTVKVGPSEFAFKAQVPRARPTNRNRSPFDPFGDDFFNAPFGAFSEVQHKKAAAEPVELTVKQLPAEGRPANFSGAVGQFALSGQGSPAKVNVGDPITMTLKVSGSGNFDRVEAPEIADPTGWRSYPPNATFKPADDMGTHGTKTFEVAVIPEGKKTQMPVFEFSYFDPTTERYRTLGSGHNPLEVIGEMPATPPPVVHAQQLGTASATPAPAAPKVVINDIHGLSYDFGKQRTFEPLYTQRAFWLAQCAPLLLLGGTLFVKLRKPKLDGGRQATLRRERATQFARLRRESDRSAFFDSAARVLQIDTALVSGQLPDAVDAATVCRVRKTSPETTGVIEEIFAARAEALYAGSGSGRDEIREADRQRIIHALEQLGGVK